MSEKIQRTPEEIQHAIDTLREVIATTPERNAFGDLNDWTLERGWIGELEDALAGKFPQKVSDASLWLEKSPKSYFSDYDL